MKHTARKYTAEPLHSDGILQDIRLSINGKTWHLWGRDGKKREAALADKVSDNALPVLLGAGLGHCIETLLARGLPVAVVDRETPLSRLTDTRQRFSEALLWLDQDDPQAVMRALSKWQTDHEGKPFAPIALPLYLRLAPAYYATLRDTLDASARTDFWHQARYPKFRDASPKVLFFDPGYFLCREISTALDRLGIAHASLSLGNGPTGSQAFIEGLLKKVIEFKPDFVLTVNHFGLDRSGKLASLLQELGLPLASWFVDNPHLILHRYAHPGTDNTVIFTYDASNLPMLKAKGFEAAHHLPLATDPQRFRPDIAGRPVPDWQSRVSFVGNSMVQAVKDSLTKANLPPKLAGEYPAIARAFGESGYGDAIAYLAQENPAWHAWLTADIPAEQALAAESLLTWEATRQYRLACVSATLPFAPLIVGDTGWHSQLDSRDAFRLLPSIDYYEDLPRFYPCAAINFNCTSRQMPGAVNQRVFDVPACGGFLLTDHRDQMEHLFDLDHEMAVYHSSEDIGGHIERYLAEPETRHRITQQARKRILAEHTYEHRLSALLDIMRQTFA